MKLQKLVYYAYAWYVANYDDPLFPEDICAWPHGPVVQELWRQFRPFGREPVTSLATEYNFTKDGNLETVVPRIPQNNEKVVALLDVVWNVYKQFNGIQLSNMTHSPDEPWFALKKRMDLGERPRLDDNLISKMFKAKLERASASQS